MHKKLEEERTRKAMFEEREHIARQLHDGIAQSIFLLSVKMKQIEAAETRLKSQKSYQQMQKIVQHMHDDVRQSNFHYRNPNSINPFPWTESMQLLIQDYEKESGLSVNFNWEIPEEQLSAKD